MRSHRLALAALMLVVGVTATSTRGSHAEDQQLAARLPDKDFWRLTEEFSEPNGYFRSDNLLSNEIYFENVVPELVQRTTRGGVYIGVGPEQNFTYIAALKPQMVFIPDIRRGNLDLQLMYKALFELSADRAEFVSRLFSKKRPEGLDSKSSAKEIFAKFWDVETSEQLYNVNLAAIINHLTKSHGLALSVDDVRGVTYVYNAFYQFGPRIQYSSTGSFGGAFQPDYADLMTATDLDGMSRSFLA